MSPSLPCRFESQNFVQHSWLGSTLSGWIFHLDWVNPGEGLWSPLLYVTVRGISIKMSYLQQLYKTHPPPHYTLRFLGLAPCEENETVMTLSNRGRTDDFLGDAQNSRLLSVLLWLQRKGQDISASKSFTYSYPRFCYTKGRGEESEQKCSF